MTMSQNQLKSWRDDFLRYYGRSSLLTRIFVGAAISFTIAFLMTNKVVKKQKDELKTLSEKIRSTEIAGDAELEVVDLKNRQRKVSRTLASIKGENLKLEEACGGLSRAETGKSFLDLRLLIDRNELKIVSERHAASQNPGKKNETASSVKSGKNLPEQIVFPSFMDSESYDFEVLGTFQNIRRFLIDAYRSDALFFLNNIRIEPSRETITDRAFIQHKALKCVFQAHIPYRTDNASKPSGKGSRP